MDTRYIHYVVINDNLIHLFHNLAYIVLNSRVAGQCSYVIRSLVYIRRFSVFKTYLNVCIVTAFRYNVYNDIFLQTILRQVEIQ